MNKLDSLKFRDSASELISKKTDLVIKKQEIENELSEIKSQIRGGGYLPKDEYARICSRQNFFKKEKLEIEKQISALGEEIRKKSDLEHEVFLRSKVNVDEERMTRLLLLKDKYMKFSSDSTRISSMRVMASEFVQEIESIIGKQ